MKWLVPSRSKRHKVIRVQEVNRIRVRVGELYRVIGWGEEEMMGVTG